MPLPRPLFLLSLFLLFASPAFSGVDDKRLRTADTDPGSWLSYGRNYAEDRFSTLSQITAENVGKLSLAWYADIPGTDLLEATPLAIDTRVEVVAIEGRVLRVVPIEQSET